MMRELLTALRHARRTMALDHRAKALQADDQVRALDAEGLGETLLCEGLRLSAELHRLTAAIIGGMR